MSKHTFISHSPENTEKAGKTLGERVALRPEWGKIILLSGNLGAGKTTFVRGFFQGIGSAETPQSPTFSFFREYHLKSSILIHADLYRFSEENPTQSLEFIAEQLQNFAQEGAIVLIEWAEILEHKLPNFFTENLIRIHIKRGNTDQEREIQVKFLNTASISEPQTLALMEEFHTPVHIRQHIFGVTTVAAQIAEKLFQNGVILDCDLVKNGALCHDLVRYVDFPNFDDLTKYQEEVTPEKLRCWTETKQQYSGMNHADTISTLLRERGFFATAKITEAHHTGQIFRSEPFSWEEKIVYYADKRVLHDRVVSLEERFTDGRKRYAHEANPELEQKVFALESEIFSRIDISPEDIR